MVQDPCFQKALQLTNDLGINDVVNFCGNVPNDKLLLAMREHDIFLFNFG